MQLTAEARNRLHANRARYRGMVEVVEHWARRGDAERVLVAAAAAANSAWNCPIGRLADPELERAVARTVRGDATLVPAADRDRGQVLHVLTEAYVTGGTPDSPTDG